MKRTGGAGFKGFIETSAVEYFGKCSFCPRGREDEKIDTLEQSLAQE